MSLLPTCCSSAHVSTRLTCIVQRVFSLLLALSSSSTQRTHDHVAEHLSARSDSLQRKDALQQPSPRCNSTAHCEHFHNRSLCCRLGFGAGMFAEFVLTYCLTANTSGSRQGRKRKALALPNQFVLVVDLQETAVVKQRDTHSPAQVPAVSDCSSKYQVACPQQECLQRSTVCTQVQSNGQQLQLSQVGDATTI